MNTALLIVDVQNDYFPGGKMELDGSVEACGRIREILRAFREGGAPVIHVQHIATKPGATFFLPGTVGVRIHASVAPGPNEKLVTKQYPNSFRETGLDAYLRQNGIERLAIVGMMTHMCIDATTRAAFDLGYVCTLLGDCCATRKLSLKGVDVDAREVQNAFLAALDGTFAKVLESEYYLKNGEIE